MAKKRNTAGTAADLKAILQNPQFRDVLLSGGRIRAGDIPLTDRPAGILPEQTINLSPVGVTQANNILGDQAQGRQINLLGDLKAALTNQQQVRGNAGQQLTANDISSISQRFMTPENRLKSQIGNIITPQSVNQQTSISTSPLVNVAATQPSIAIGQNVLNDSSRLGGAKQKVSNMLRQGLLRLQQTATGGVSSAASGATAAAVNPSLTPSNPLPEDIVARTLQDIKTRAQKVVQGTTLEDKATKILTSIDPRFGKLSRKQRSEIAGFQFKDPATNQIITITKDGGFQVTT